MNRERSWRRAGCPAGSSYPGGKERAGVCPHPRAGGDSGDIWDSHGTRGHSGMAPVMSEGISQSSQIPAAPGSATENPKSSVGIPSASLSPRFPPGIYLYCGLNRVTPPHPSQSAGHGHSLSHALGVGMGSRQLPGAWGSRREGMRSCGLDVIPSNLLGKRGQLQRERCVPRATAGPIYGHQMFYVCPIYVLYVSGFI